MKKITFIALLCLSLASQAMAEQAKGLNVIITSADRQAQMMGMVLSMMTMKEHKKSINMVLCAAAGDLALKSTETVKFKPVDKSPTMMLHGLLKMGANIKVCPLYLPNANKSKEDLIDGITIGVPTDVADMLLDTEFQNLVY